MKQFILKHQKAVMGTLAILLIGGITMSFQDSPFAYSKFSVQEDYVIYGHCSDTIPDKESMKMKDFDKLQTDLDKTLLQVTDELKKPDFSKIQKDIAESLKDVEMEKIRKDVERSLQSINMAKMMAELSSSLKNLNLDQKHIEKALSDAKKEIEKIKPELKDVDKLALENAKKEISKAKLEIEKIDMDKIMTEAGVGIEKAKRELKEIKDMFNEMEKDGLINSKNGFTIEYKNKALYIDGKKQTEKTTDKYRKYFKKDNFKITIDKD